MELAMKHRFVAPHSDPAIEGSDIVIESGHRW